MRRKLAVNWSVVDWPSMRRKLAVFVLNPITLRSVVCELCDCIQTSTSPSPPSSLLLHTQTVTHNRQRTFPSSLHLLLHTQRVTSPSSLHLLLHARTARPITNSGEDSCCVASMRPLISKAQIVRAERLLATRVGIEEEDEAQNIVLASGVPSNRAKAFLDSEDKHNLVFRYVDGNLIAVDLTGRPHSKCTQSIMSFFPSSRHLLPGNNETVFIQGDAWVPDGVVEPYNRQPKEPTIVIEVGDSESLKSLYRCATSYLHATTAIQMVICVKLWNPHTNGNRAMLFMSFDRNNPSAVNGYVQPSHAISFGNANLHQTSRSHLMQWGVPANVIRGKYSGSGDPPCSAPNQALYRVEIGAAVVFNGSAVPIPAAILQNGYTIDLFDVQWTVLNS